VRKLSIALWVIESLMILKIVGDNSLILSQVKSPLLAPAVFIMVLYIAVRNYDLIERFIGE
jgi:hypothetical protein